MEIYLEPGTAVNVTLRANYTEMEVPYTAELISHYEDGVTTSRVITGTRQEETLVDITPEFGAVYFLSNYSLVPTTVPPPTTEPPTTTTTITTTVITTTMTTKRQEINRTTQRHRDKTNVADHDENMILSPEKTDISTSMQGDDGGPVSLKKVEVSYNAGAAFTSSLTLVVPLLLILYRIT